MAHIVGAELMDDDVDREATLALETGLERDGWSWFASDPECEAEISFAIGRTAERLGRTPHQDQRVLSYPVGSPDTPLAS